MIKHILIAITIAATIACATVSSPKGGEKDKDNPVLLNSTPKNQQTNYKQQELTLTFSEWIKVEQINKELIITPKTDLKYEIDQRKEVLTIKFLSPLEDSTTYTFNFRKAIKDITEANLWENPTLAFSTGPYLDSMEVQGKVKALFTNKGVENFVVGLYPSAIDTANLREGYPMYFTTTDKQGNYKIQNIKSGQYKIYSFSDQNDNLINNSHEESFGFHPSVLNLRDSNLIIDINTYYSNEDSLKQKNSGPSGKDFKISFNKPIGDYTIQTINNSKKYVYANLENEAQEIRVYKENFPNIGNDSIAVYLNIKDSIGSIIHDTIYIKFRNSKINNDPIKISEKPVTTIFPGKQSFQIAFNKPLRLLNFDSLAIYAGDSIIIKHLTQSEVSLDQHKKNLIINTIIDKQEIDRAINHHQINVDSIHQSKKVQANDTTNSSADKGRPTQLKLTAKLGFKKGTFIGIEQDTVTAAAYDIKFLDIKDFGSIEGTILHGEDQYIVLLMSEKYDVVDTIITNSSYAFKRVNPGNYYISIVADKNKNAKWDIGHPLQLIPEEKVFHYKEIITLKANWERQGIDFNMTDLLSK